MIEIKILPRLQKIISNIVEEDLKIDGTVLLKALEDEKISLGLSSLDLMDLIIQTEMEFEIEIDQERYSDLYDVNSLIQMIEELLNSNETQENQIEQIQGELFS